MSEIPDDITKSAKALCAPLDIPATAGTVYVISDALLRERQRCAEYARAYLEDISGCNLSDDEPERIARGIMRGDPFVAPDIEIPGGGEE